jgi:hypothetical protein
MNITRNRQQVSFSTDHTDGDIVQTSEFLNSADLPIPLKDFLIGGVHVVASTGPLARQAIRARAALLDEASVPDTHHLGRCYCQVFAGEYHVPGTRQAGAYGAQCQGDRSTPHDEKTCGACRAGATDFRPVIEAGQTWISNNHGTDHQVQGPGDEAGTWAMWGPVGNLYVISEARLYSAYTLDLDR